jgi:hypothetical protein
MKRFIAWVAIPESKENSTDEVFKRFGNYQQITVEAPDYDSCFNFLESQGYAILKLQADLNKF